MNKLGVHSYIFTETWSDQQLDILDQARSLGAAVFELSLIHISEPTRPY